MSTVPDEPWTPSLDDVQLPGEALRSAIFQALGGASVCWETPEGAGEFDVDTARWIGHGLLTWINENGWHKG